MGEAVSRQWGPLALGVGMNGGVSGWVGRARHSWARAVVFHVWVCECRVCTCASVEVCKCASVSVRKCASVHMRACVH
eukprot:4528622-Alexandrium_andersonii.AAC.2